MNNGKYKPTYSLISKYRTVLMGLAIIMIMFCHLDVAQEQNGIAETSLARALHIFTVGVDAFMFLSGIGLYYSYTKKQQSCKQFEKKRLTRILPYYILIGGGTYLINDVIIRRLSIKNFLSDLLFISWLQGESTKYWYILAIVAFYLLFPVLYRFIHGGKDSLLKISLFSICWWVLVEVLCKFVPSVDIFRIALARLPIFAIGIYFGKLSYEKKEIQRSIAFMLLTTGYVLFIGIRTPLVKPVAGYLYYPARAWLSISIMTTIIMLMEAIEKKRTGFYNCIGNVLSWFGRLTLELYLLHQSYMILLKYPYKLTSYLIAAFVLPTVTAGVIYRIRKKLISARENAR